MELIDNISKEARRTAADFIANVFFIVFIAFLFQVFFCFVLSISR